jgi:hypothetical protein
MDASFYWWFLRVICTKSPTVACPVFFSALSAALGKAAAGAGARQWSRFQLARAAHRPHIGFFRKIEVERRRKPE